MEIKTTISAIIAAVVCLIIVVTVAVPIISDTSDNIRGIDHNDTMRFMMIDDEADTEMLLIKTGDNAFTLNGAAVPNDVDNWCIMTDNTVFKHDSYSTYFLIGSSSKTMNVGDSMLWSNGEWTATINGVSTTGTYDFILYPNNSGNYAMFIGADVWVDRDATIYSYKEYPTNTEGQQVPIMYVNGSVDDGFNYNAYYGGSAVTATVGFSSIESGDYADKGRIQVTYGNNATATLPILIAPFTYHVDNGMSEAMKSIVNIIPLLMIVGIIVGVVSLFIRQQ